MPLYLEGWNLRISMMTILGSVIMMNHFSFLLLISMYIYIQYYTFLKRSFILRLKKKKHLSGMFGDPTVIVKFVHLFLLLVEGGSQKGHPKDGPRRTDAEERSFQQIQPESSVL